MFRKRTRIGASWHLYHARNCDCRKIDGGITVLFKRGGTVIPPLKLPKGGEDLFERRHPGLFATVAQHSSIDGQPSSAISMPSVQPRLDAQSRAPT